MTEIAAKTVLAPEDDVKHVPLSDIHVDWAWNSRSYAYVIAEHSEMGDEEGSGITGLVKGVFYDGQDTPIDLRPATKEDKAGNRPYVLVSGFRRYEAIRRLNTPKVATKEGELGEISAEFLKVIENRRAEKKQLVPNTGDGTIRAVVRNIDERQAELLNLRENTNRDDLTTPDLCMAVRRIVQKQGLTPTQLADRLGKSQGHMTTLIQVGRCHNDILDHWRNGGDFVSEGVSITSKKRVNVRDLVDISKIEKEKQLAEYARLLKSKLPASEAAEDKNSWMVAAKNKAEKLGTLLGQLAKAGFLKIIPKDKESWKPYIVTMVKVGKKDPSNLQSRSIANAAFKAYEKALTAEDEVEEEDEEAAE